MPAFSPSRFPLPQLRGASSETRRAPSPPFPTAPHDARTRQSWTVPAILPAQTPPACPPAPPRALPGGYGRLSPAWLFAAIRQPLLRQTKRNAAPARLLILAAHVS